MSRVDDLIREFCPEGVSIRGLLEVATVHKGTQLRDEDFAEGPFPVVTASRKELRSHLESNFGPGIVTITSHGAYAGHVNYWDSEIWLANNVLLVEPNPSSLSSRFLYFLLSARQAEVAALARGGGVPYFNARDLSRISVPIPPLPVQEEIVRILDTFTELEAELEAELKARTTQYEETRNRLMAFDDVEGHPLSGLIRELCPDGVNRRPLSEITSLRAGDRIVKSMMRPESLFPVYGGGSEPTGRFSDHNFEDALTVSRAGSAGSVNWIEGPFWATDVCFVASQLEGGPDLKFVYYLVKSQEFELKRHIYGGSMPKLDKRFLWNLPIPVPPVPVQEEIVRILDAFEALVTDLSAGLPAEIAARRRQYEYYRDNLLSFEDVAT